MGEVLSGPRSENWVGTAALNEAPAHRIGRPLAHMSVADWWAGGGVDAVFVICLSPSATGTRPANRRDKRIFFCKNATANEEKDNLSLMFVLAGEIPSFAVAQRRAKYPALAEYTARCFKSVAPNTGAKT
jgi:hypothetical protein